MSQIIVRQGEEIKIFKRNEQGAIVYDIEGKLQFDGGYPYVTLERNVLATGEDFKNLVENILSNAEINQERRRLK